MIICNLRTLMAERGLAAVKVSEDTGISRTTLSALYNNGGQGIQFETLNTLCGYLGVEPGEFFTFIQFEIKLGEFHHMSDEIPFIVAEVGKKSKTYLVPFDVDVNYGTYDLSDDDGVRHGFYPESANVRIGSISVNGEEPSKEEKILWSYYNKLPVRKRVEIIQQITETLEEDLYRSIDSDVVDAIGDNWEGMEIDIDVDMDTE